MYLLFIANFIFRKKCAHFVNRKLHNIAVTLKHSSCYPWPTSRAQFAIFCAMQPQQQRSNWRWCNGGETKGVVHLSGAALSLLPCVNTVLSLSCVKPLAAAA